MGRLFYLDCTACVTTVALRRVQKSTLRIIRVSKQFIWKIINNDELVARVTNIVIRKLDKK